MLFTKMSQAVLPIMNQIHDLSFNRELAKGSLPKETFLFYIGQDTLYLADYSRALALTAARLSNQNHVQEFIQFSLGAIQAERELHTKYQKVENPYTEQAPFCFMYTNYLLKMASTASVEEAVASLLPCFWVYREVAKRMTEKPVDSNHPYHEWLALYSGETFSDSVEVAIMITNELAEKASLETQNNMLAAFKRATQLEWRFWHGAYAKENWY